MANAPSAQACAAQVLDTTLEVLCTIRNELRGKAGIDLTMAQFRTLKQLQRKPGSNLSDLAEEIGVTAPALSKLVDGLVLRGLAGRAAHAADRRHIELQVTAEGRRALDRVRQAVVLRFAERLAGLSPADRSAIAAALTTLLEAFRPQEVRA
jgi:DNA-binding MarR family transcriptional regulator